MHRQSPKHSNPQDTDRSYPENGTSERMIPLAMASKPFMGLLSVPKHSGTRPLQKDSKRNTSIEWKPGTFHGTDALGLHAKRFLKKARTTPEKPWFLYLAFNAPHFPLHAFKHDIEKYSNRYQGGWDELRKERLDRMKKLGIVDQSTQLTPRSPWWNYGETQTGKNPAWKDLPKDRRDDLARRMAIYAAMVDQMDRCIGSLVDDIRKNKELDNTFILFTADNGACAEWDPKGSISSPAIKTFSSPLIELMKWDNPAHSTAPVQDGPMLETRHGDSISTSTTKVASAPELFIGLKGISERHHRAPTRPHYRHPPDLPSTRRD